MKRYILQVNNTNPKDTQKHETLQSASQQQQRNRNKDGDRELYADGRN